MYKDVRTSALATLRNQQVHINEVANKVKQTLQGKLKKKKMLVGNPKTYVIFSCLFKLITD